MKSFNETLQNTVFRTWDKSFAQISLHKLCEVTPQQKGIFNRDMNPMEKTAQNPAWRLQFSQSNKQQQKTKPPKKETNKQKKTIKKPPKEQQQKRKQNLAFTK